MRQPRTQQEHDQQIKYPFICDNCHENAPELWGGKCEECRAELNSCDFCGEELTDEQIENNEFLCSDYCIKGHKNEL